MQTENTYVETDLGNIALNPRGEYSGEASYEHLDTVSYMGGSYVCLAELTKTISGIGAGARRKHRALADADSTGAVNPGSGHNA